MSWDTLKTAKSTETKTDFSFENQYFAKQTDGGNQEIRQLQCIALMCRQILRTSL